MPRVKSKKKKLKKEAGEVALEMETEDGTTSRDPLTSEPGDPAPQKKKKKKRTPPTDQDTDNLDVPNGTTDEPGGDGEEQNVPATRKTRRKRKVKLPELHGNELEDEDEVIVSDGQSPTPQLALFSAPHGPPGGRGPVGRNRHLQAERVDQLRHSELVNDYMDPRQMWTTKDVAMKVHSSFRVLGLFSHGFLAGFAVWNVVVVYVLAGEQLRALTNLLQQYHLLAHPAQSLLYLLLAISTVSAFDSVFYCSDPVAQSANDQRPHQPLSVRQPDFMVRTHSARTCRLPGAFQGLPPPSRPPGSEQQILRPWIVVNLVVALLVGLAWVVVSTRPNTDYTEDFLMTMEVDGYPRGDDTLDMQA